MFLILSISLWISNVQYLTWYQCVIGPREEYLNCELAKYLFLAWLYRCGSVPFFTERPCQSVTIGHPAFSLRIPLSFQMLRLPKSRILPDKNFLAHRFIGYFVPYAHTAGNSPLLFYIGSGAVTVLLFVRAMIYHLRLTESDDWEVESANKTFIAVHFWLYYLYSIRMSTFTMTLHFLMARQTC